MIFNKKNISYLLIFVNNNFNFFFMSKYPPLKKRSCLNFPSHIFYPANNISFYFISLSLKKSHLIEISLSSGDNSLPFDTWGHLERNKFHPG